MNESLRSMLRKLRLSGMYESIDIRRQEAISNQLDYLEFLELCLQDELLVRDDRKRKRRVKGACFPQLKTVDQFDWSFNPSLNKKQLFDLSTCAFIRQSRDILFIGPPGTGKTHLAISIGYQAIKQNYIVLYRSIFDLVRDFKREEALEESRLLSKYLRSDLLIIDDMGLKQLPKNSGEYLFEVIMRRNELKSTLMTSNRPIEDWGNLIGDVPTAGAILDRFLQHSEIVQFKGRSYRLSRNLQREESP